MHLEVPRALARGTSRCIGRAPRNRKLPAYIVFRIFQFQDLEPYRKCTFEPMCSENFGKKRPVNESWRDHFGFPCKSGRVFLFVLQH